MEITADMPVRDIAIELPATIQVLERFRIDHVVENMRWQKVARSVT